MRRLGASHRKTWAILLSGLSFVFSLAAKSEAAVGDVTLTGLPPNSEISLRDEATGQTETKRSDDRGGVIFFWGSRNSRAGNFTVTARNPSLFSGTPSRRIQLKDGNNKVDLTGLVTVMGGAVPRMANHILDLNLSTRIFGNLPQVGASFAIRGDYIPPVKFFEDTFSVSPYVSGWLIPSVNIAGHRPFDFRGVYQAKVDSGTIGGINVGAKHVSPLGKWGSGPNAPDMVGMLMAGGGWVHYNFDMKRLNNPEPKFVDARDFNSSGNGFRMEFNVGLAASWKNGYHLGFRGGVGPTFIDIFNGGAKGVTETNLGVTLGYRW